MGLLEDIQADNLRREGKKNFSDSYHPEMVKRSPPQPSPSPKPQDKQDNSDLSKTATNYFDAMTRRRANLDSSK